MSQNDAISQCICSWLYSELFLNEFGSNRVSCHFNTTAKRIFLLLTPIGNFDRFCFMTS